MTLIHVITQGCSYNKSDSEKMIALLKDADFNITDTLEEADLVIINSCTVKSPTENKFFRMLKKITKPVIIAGCIAQTDPEKLAGYSLIGTDQIERIVEIVEETRHGNAITCVSRQKGYIDIKQCSQDPVIEIIPISTGCLGGCTFCKTKAARGMLSSRSPESIMIQAKEAVKAGKKELWITSQDNGCYGFDIGTDLSQLLNKMVKIPGDFYIRVGMANPNHLLKIKEDLIKIFPHKKIFQFLHLPVQAGSDMVLKDMKRNYSIEQFRSLVNDFRTVMPDITLGTDIICGFPGETDEQFEETLDLVREIEFDVINISKFWARPKTQAASMKQLHGSVIKERSRRLTELCHNISQLRNERWVGWQGRVVVDEGHVGRNFAYKPVDLGMNYKAGTFVDVRIRAASVFCLKV